MNYSIRLNHFLAQSGINSRRSADVLIEEGKVTINGKVSRKLGVKINPETDIIEVSGKRLSKAPESKIVYALFKPKGYVASMKKQDKDPIIKSLLPTNPRVFPVGRLDKDSDGLLIVTNDGELTQKLTHPTQHVAKTYRVICKVPKNYTENALQSQIGRLSRGIKIDGYMTKPSSIKLILEEPERGTAQLEIVLHEGRNRQIRRMLGRINCEVIKLTRVAIGALRLDDLNIQKGEYRILDDHRLNLVDTKGK